MSKTEHILQDFKLDFELSDIYVNNKILCHVICMLFVLFGFLPRCFDTKENTIMIENTYISAVESEPVYNIKDIIPEANKISFKTSPIKEEFVSVEKLMINEKDNIIMTEINGEFDILQPSGYYVEDLLKAFEGSSYDKIRPYTETLIKAEKEFGVNALFLTSLIGLESGWCRYTCTTNNVAGWRGDGGLWRKFASVEDCILYIAKELSTTYKEEVGTSLEDVCSLYCNGNFVFDSNRDNVYTKELIKIMKQRKAAIEDV